MAENAVRIHEGEGKVDIKAELDQIHSELLDVCGGLELIGARLVLDASDGDTANSGSIIEILGKHLRGEAVKPNNLFLKMQ